MRVVIAFDGKIGWSGYAGFSDMNAAVGMGEEQKVPVVKVDDEQFVSQVTVKGKHVLVGFDEVQECTDNRFTAASVACLRKEFSDLMAAKDWDAVMRLMPNGTVSDEGNLLRVYHNGIGTYQCFIRINPGEEGVVHIRVADPKTGSHLWMTETHRPTIRTRTNEYVGWSADTNETFFASSGFTMYDGAYGKPSPVNVEVWFTPNAGGSERKLIEQSFNLEAWER